MLQRQSQSNLDQEQLPIRDKTKIVIKTILISSVITMIGVFSWPLFLGTLPGYLPILAISLFLLVYWKYLTGSGPPVKWKSFRNKVSRQKNLSQQQLIQTFIITILFVATIQASFMVTFRLIEFPADSITSAYSFDTMPRVQAWVFILFSALTAGVTEEIGFRGYGQVPLETHIGPKFAVFFTSLLFMFVHINQAWAPPIIFHIFGAGLLFGLIAWYTKSLIPGIVAHTVLDIFNFSYWWSNILGEFQWDVVFETGLDVHFVFWISIFLVSLSLLLLYLSRLNKLGNN